MSTICTPTTIQTKTNCPFLKGLRDINGTQSIKNIFNNLTSSPRGILFYCGAYASYLFYYDPQESYVNNTALGALVLTFGSAFATHIHYKQEMEKIKNNLLCCYTSFKDLDNLTEEQKQLLRTIAKEVSYDLTVTQPPSKEPETTPRQESKGSSNMGVSSSYTRMTGPPLLRSNSANELAR